MENTQNQIQVKTNQNVQFNFFDAEQFATMQRVCKMFAYSDLVPNMYRASQDNPEHKAVANCMIAINMAMKIGADPLSVMQNMYIVHGKPSWSSKFLIATVNTSGRFEPLKFKFKEKGMLGKIPYVDYEWSGGKKQAVTKTFDGTKVMNIECIAYTTAKGSDELLESAPIDLELAIKEGWYLKPGSKWPTMTKQMLIYRSASFWTNAYAPEVSMGMMTVEERNDIIDIDYKTVEEKVEEKIEQEANKTVIGFDEERKEEVKEEPKPEEKPEVKEETKPEVNTEKEVQKTVTGQAKIGF